MLYANSCGLKYKKMEEKFGFENLVVWQKSI